MASINQKNLDIRGTVTECPPITPTTGEKVVYQKTGKGFGNISNGGRYDRQRRRYVIPADPRTAAQLARRAKFASAIATWQVMSEEQRDEWKAQAQKRKISSFNAFISAYMKL